MDKKIFNESEEYLNDTVVKDSERAHYIFIFFERVEA